MPHFPSPEMVAVAWAKTVPGIDPTKVATTLPGAVAVWGATGFVTVSVLNSDAAPDVPLFSPVVAFDCWTAATDSNQAPWGQASAMAAALQWATYRRSTVPVVMPASYSPARLLSMYPVDGPRRVPSDPAGFARVRVTVALVWTCTAEVAA